MGYHSLATPTLPPPLTSHEGFLGRKAPWKKKTDTSELRSCVREQRGGPGLSFLIPVFPSP